MTAQMVCIIKTVLEHLFNKRFNLRQRGKDISYISRCRNIQFIPKTP